MPDSGLRNESPQPTARRTGRRLRLPRVLRTRLSIATVFVLGFGGLVLAAVASVLAIGLWSGSRNTLDLLGDKAAYASELMVMRARRHLDPAHDQVSFLVRMIEQGEIDPDDRERLSDYLIGALAATPQVRGLAFIDTDFDVLRASRSPTGPVVGLVNWSDAPDVRAEMEAARARTGPYWAELVWSNVARSTLINLRSPVRRRGAFAGIVVSIVAVNDLSRFITSAEGLIPGNTFILYGTDRVLAHRNMATAVPKLKPGQALPGLDEVGDPVLAAIWRKEATSPIDSALQGRAQGHAVKVEGEDYIFLYREIGDYGAVPWIVGTYFRESDELRREFGRIATAGIAGGLILLVSLIAAMALGRRMGVPIRALAEAARGVSGLDLAKVGDLKRSRVREIDDAATAFNAMVGGLRWFETYVPRGLVRQLVGRGRPEPIRSEEREVTVLFTDITGFTALVEHMSATEAADLLNEHFALVARAIEDEGGTIDKYIGDSVMAFWGAPAPMPDHAARACRAALAIRRAVTLDNEARRRQDLPPIRLRVGIHTGRAIVGNIGAPGRINYTLVGDTVNVAQRLEELAREVADPGRAVSILASGAVAAKLGDEFGVVPEGERALRGREGEIRVFRLE